METLNAIANGNGNTFVVLNLNEKLLTNSILVSIIVRINKRNVNFHATSS